MKRAGAALGLLGLLAVLAASGQPVRADPGIAGKVVNGSAGGGGVGGLEVTLALSLEAASTRTRTDGGGQFAFPTIALSTGETYILTVRYQDVDYAKTLRSGQDAGNADLYVYDTTADTGALSVLLDHHIVEVRPEEKRLAIVNYIQALNGSDRTIVPAAGGEEASLFPLPQGAEHVEVLQATEDTPAEGATTLTRALPPGEHKVLLAYELPYEGDSLLFQKPVAYPTARGVFLLSETDGRAASEQLPAAEEVETASGGFWLLSGEELAAGTGMDVRLSELAGRSTASRSYLFLAPIAVVLLLGAGGVSFYLLLRKRRAQEAAA